MAFRLMKEDQSNLFLVLILLLVVAFVLSIMGYLPEAIWMGTIVVVGVIIIVGIIDKYKTTKTDTKGLDYLERIAKKYLNREVDINKGLHIIDGFDEEKKYGIVFDDDRQDPDFLNVVVFDMKSGKPRNKYWIRKVDFTTRSLSEIFNEIRNIITPRLYYSTVQPSPNKVVYPNRPKSQPEQPTSPQKRGQSSD